MAKLALTDIANLQNETSATAAINNNNLKIEQAIENTVSRDGTSPNSMNADFDMNGNRILNLPDAEDDSEPVTLSQVSELIPTFYVQDTEPSADPVDGSIWLDSNSSDYDVYLRVSGAWQDTGVNLEGATGDTGATGATGPSIDVFIQNSAPATSGTAGSLWIDADSSDLDLYKLIAAAWVDTTVNLKGAQGTQGIQGEPGDTQEIYVQNDAPATTGPDGSLWVDANSAGNDLYRLQSAAWVDTGVNLKGADGAGTGDVVGPSSATDNSVALFDSTTGKLIKEGATTVHVTTGVVGGSAGLVFPNTGLKVQDTNASHNLTIAPGSDLTAARTLTLTTGDAPRTITLSGNPTLADWFDQAVKEASSPTFADLVVTSITIPNTGLHILDTNATHDLIIAPGSNLTADRTLTVTTGDADRTVTLSGNPTLSDWFDQSVKIAASPTFTALRLSNTYAYLQLIESDGGSNAKNWRLYTDGDTLAVAALNDAEDTVNTILTFARSGATPTSMTSTVPVILPNTGLRVLDTNASHSLIIKPGSNVTADRTLTVTTGDTDIEVDFTDAGSDKIMFWDDSAAKWTALTLNAGLEISGTTIRAIETHGIALSDEITAITTGTNKATMSLPYAFTVTSVYATLNTVSSSGTPTVDINEAGTTILSTKLTIDANEKTSATAASAAVISDSAIAANAEIGFDIDTAGTGAKGLKVFIQGYRT